ncbi:bifunctional precorrin-2 dehydrogenase/sirohydrochlorin ferrochelatase [Segetibacter sp.]|uniref:precorrin-2 dehydrogenase/sirohydrochlorin ferrochelatase family protein n=1 Tax=Segetibacter sp. TaxID=2231182 RepID=UPI00262BC4BE|nr:bifunctional precorrin-2 dehydrogenase/sirohydrochlorin ferrochelatase [Segetibacter sp.]
MKIKEPLNSGSELPLGLGVTNNLFPVFLKLEQMRLLIVGGGNIGLEKLSTVLQNSPSTKIRLIGITVIKEIRQLAIKYPNIELHERSFEENDLALADIVITALNDHKASEEICVLAKQHGKLINAADKPDLCDFYLGSVVKKGNLKIAISTNGKSPTIAKRLKEVISSMLPDELESILNNMQAIRNDLQGDFNEKVKQLNDLTKVLVAKQIDLKVAKKPEDK